MASSASRLVVGWVSIMCLFATSGTAEAQIVSPEVHADNSVTFRVSAPNATSVQVKGLEGQQSLPLTRGQNGVWEGTTGPLEPELYSYLFDIDGATVLDLHNRSLKRWFTLESLLEIPGTPPLLHEQWPVSHGAVTHHIYDSESVGVQRGVYVYTPPDYDAGLPGGYPLLLLLHGFGDDEGAWIEVGRANFIADNLISQGRLRPMIIVMPYGHPVPVSQRRFSDEYRSANNRAMERDVMGDLVPFVSESYNISQDRLEHAITGLSMGGGHSLSIGLSNTDFFAWIGAFSAAAPPTKDLDKTFPELIKDIDATNDRIRLLWIACGKDDFLLSANEDFRTWLDSHGINNVFTRSEGAHTWFVWRKYLAEFGTMLFRDGR